MQSLVINGGYPYLRVPREATARSKAPEVRRCISSVKNHAGLEGLVIQQHVVAGPLGSCGGRTDPEQPKYARSSHCL